MRGHGVGSLGANRAEQLGLDRGLGILHVAPLARPLDDLAGQRGTEVGRDQRLFNLFPGVVIEWAAQDPA